MANNVQLILYPITDRDKAKTFYNAFLGTEPYVDGPYYVGYKAGNLEVGLVPNAVEGPIAFIEVEDIKSTLQTMTEAGAEITQEPKDVGGGMLVAQIKDADGNFVGFRQQP